MKIWIINQYASLPSDGIGGRHRHLARELAGLGHKVTVVAARRSHLTRDVRASSNAPEVEDFEGFRFVRINVVNYRGAHSPVRVFNWALFAFRILALTRRLRESPDVILYSSPSLIGYLAAERLARRTGARLVFEVRDIWPLTLIELGSHSPRHPFIRLLQSIEDRAYRNADLTISNLPGAGDHMANRGMDSSKFEWIPNGMSEDELDTPPAHIPVELEQAVRGRFVVGYTGTLGLVASLETALEAASLLAPETGILFALVGSGSEEARLQEAATRMNLNNVIFIPPVPKSHVQSVIGIFDVCLLCWHSSPLYEYGIAANKLFDYFYAAKPVLHAYSGRHDPVSLYKAGVTVPAGDPEALAAAILRIRDAPESVRARMGRNGRRAALLHHEYGELARRLERVLLP